MIKGKTIGLVGSILLIVMQILSIYVFIFLTDISYLAEFEEMYIETFINEGFTLIEAQKFYSMWLTILDIGFYISIALIVVGVVTLILVVRVNAYNTKAIGIALLVISAVFLFANFIAFILLIISGIQILNYSKENDLESASQMYIP